MKKNKFVVLFLFLALNYSACLKDNLDTSLINRKSDNNVSALVPVGFLSSTLDNILADQVQNGTLQKDSTGLFWLKYELPFDTLYADSLIKFPDKAVFFAVNNMQSIDLATIKDSLVIIDTFYVDFGFSAGLAGEELDSIRLKNMQLGVEIKSAYSLNSKFTLFFPGFSFHGKEYSKSLIVNSNNSFSDFKDISINLKNTAKVKNRIPIISHLVLFPDAGNIAAKSSLLNLSFDFKFIDFTALYGYLGQIDVPVPESKAVFDFYQNNFSGSFHFEHSTLNFYSANSMGFPLSFYLNNMYAITADKSTRQIILSDNLTVQNPANIAFPSLSEEGRFIKDTTSIDISGLQLFADNYATEIHAQLQGKINPNGKKEYNFLHKSDFLSLNLEFTIPLWGYTNNLNMQDTLAFVLVDFYPDDFAKIERLLFVLNFTNRFPVDAFAQIYFYDKNNTLLDSLFDSMKLIPSSRQKDENDKIVANEIDPIKAEIGKERVLTLANTAYVVMRSRLKTIDYDANPPVSWKFFDEYYLSVQLGVAAEISAK